MEAYAVLVWVLFGFVAAVIASSKGRTGCGWFILGVLLGPFSLVIIFLSSKKDKQIEKVAAGGKDDQYRKCPFCAEVVLREAVKCKHCGSDIGVAVTEPPKPAVVAVVRSAEELAKAKKEQAIGTAVIGVFIIAGAIWAAIAMRQSYETDSQKKAQTEKAEWAVYNQCVQRGVAYFKSIDSHPKLSDGRVAETVAEERCRRTLSAF